MDPPWVQFGKKTTHSGACLQLGELPEIRLESLWRIKELKKLWDMDFAVLGPGPTEICWDVAVLLTGASSSSLPHDLEDEAML